MLRTASALKRIGVRWTLQNADFMNYANTVEKVMSLLKEKKVCSSSRKSHRIGTVMNLLDRILIKTVPSIQSKCVMNGFLRLRKSSVYLSSITQQLF